MKATYVYKAVLGLKNNLNIQYRNYQRLVADTIQETGDQDLWMYDMTL